MRSKVLVVESPSPIRRMAAGVFQIKRLARRVEMIGEVFGVRHNATEVVQNHLELAENTDVRRLDARGKQRTQRLLECVEIMKDGPAFGVRSDFRRLRTHLDTGQLPVLCLVA